MISGCFQNKAPLPGLLVVTGRVTLDDKPVSDVLVRYVPKQGTPGNGGTAHTDTNGDYILKGSNGEKGTYRGAYSVIFLKYEMPNGSSVEKDVQPESVGAKQVLPTIYTDASTSQVEATVTEDTHAFDFSLKSK